MFDFVCLLFTCLFIICLFIALPISPSSLKPKMKVLKEILGEVGGTTSGSSTLGILTQQLGMEHPMAIQSDH